jgi:predicted Zn-dependent peptidase
VTVPKMEFKHSSLPNGLEIYAVEDHSAPIVAVQV